MTKKSGLWWWWLWGRGVGWVILLPHPCEGNCHNSRTSDDHDMTFGPLTKIDKRNKAISKKNDEDVISENFDIIAIFSIYVQFGATRKLDSRSVKVVWSVNVL